MFRSAASSARPRISSAPATAPVGFAGLLNRISFVRGVMAAWTTRQVDAEVGIGVDQHGLAADQLHQRLVHHEERIEDDHLVARVDQRPASPAPARRWCRT